jgi:hypothetical protein
MCSTVRHNLAECVVLVYVAILSAEIQKSQHHRSATPCEQCRTLHRDPTTEGSHPHDLRVSFRLRTI